MNNHLIAILLALQLLFTPLPNSAGKAHAQDTMTVIVDSVFIYWEWCQSIAVDMLDNVSDYNLDSSVTMRGP